MSFIRRKVELRDCDCNFYEDTVKTVHCENSDGNMRCEICGRVKSSAN